MSSEHDNLWSLRSASTDSNRIHDRNGNSVLKLVLWEQQMTLRKDFILTVHTEANDVKMRPLRVIWLERWTSDVTFWHWRADMRERWLLPQQWVSGRRDDKDQVVVHMVGITPGVSQRKKRWRGPGSGSRHYPMCQSEEEETTKTR